MAKDRKKVLHIHSNIPGKQPLPSQLEIGEIAVNTAEGKEFLSIKNSNENNSKIVRFSSDEQMVDWMEKKEVFPYSGSIDSVDDVNNTSNLVLKFNQKAASGTPHSSDVNNGSGFTINMDKYAMIGANPSFSSVTADAINGKQFETELTDDSDAKVPTSKAVADYTNDAISSYTEGKFALQSDLIKDERVISSALNDLNDRVEELENTQIEIPTSITDLDEYDSATTEFNFGGAKVKNIGYGYIESGLTVEGETILNDTLNIYADSNIIDDLTVSGDTTIGGELKFGSKNTSNIIKSEYDEDIHGDYLNIGGGEYIKLNNDAIVNDDLTVLGESYLSGVTNIYDTLNAEMGARIHNGLYVTFGGLNVTGDTTLKDALNVSGNTTLSTVSASSISADTIELNLNDSEEDKTYDNVINANGITLNYNDGHTNYDTTVSGGVIRFSDDDLGRSSQLTYYNLLLNDDSVDNSTTVTMNGVTITDGENAVNVNSNGIDFGGSNFIKTENDGDTLVICGGELIRLETDLDSQYSATFDTVDAHSISADTIVARNLQEKELAISSALNDLNDRVDEMETNLSEEITTNKLNVENINLNGSNEIIGKYDSDIDGDYLYLCGGEYIDLDNLVYIQKYNGGPGQLVLFVNGDTVVNGNMSANTITQTSDIKLKKNIESISYEKAVKANDLEIKQFNFINDETNRTIYGVIAQEAEELGLNEIVYGNETKSVDYNSLIMLKLAYLEKENKSLKQDLIKLSERISKLEKDN